MNGESDGKQATTRSHPHQNGAVLFEQRLQLRPELLGVRLVARGHVTHERHQLGETVAVL